MRDTYEKGLLPLVKVQKKRRQNAIALAEFVDRSVFEQMQDAHLIGATVLTGGIRSMLRVVFRGAP
jgi:hypothetical protein